MWREGCGSCAAPLPQQLSGNTARRAPPSGGFDHSRRTGAAVETVPREVRTELSSGGAPGATARLRFSPAYAPVELGPLTDIDARSEEHTSELQSQSNLVCRLLLEKKKEYLYYL